MIPAPRPRSRGLPAALAGGALAVSTQVAAGLLLYGGPGFLPALSVILAVAATALGVGLGWGGRLVTADDAVERARRGWFLLLVALALAAGFTASWEIFRGFGAPAPAQALGLLFLVALPLLVGGRLLALLRNDGSRGRHALYGAAVGTLLLGHLFFPSLSPTAVLLLCVVATSGGALTHGWLLDERLHHRLQEVGPYHLRELHRTRPPLHRIELVSPARLELARGAGGVALDPVDQALEDALIPHLPPAGTILAAGWRAAVPALRTHHPGSSLTLLLSEDAAVAGEGLALLSGGAVPRETTFLRSPPRASLHHRILLGWGEEEPDWEGWRECLHPEGVLVVVGVPDTPGMDGVLGTLARARGATGLRGHAWIGPEVARGSEEAPVQGGGAPPAPPRREGILLLEGAGLPAGLAHTLPDRPGRLLRVEGEG